MKSRALALKRNTAHPSVDTVEGPVFAMLDPPGVEDAHGDTMDAGALVLPDPGADGLSRVPLYWIHSYSDQVVADASPSERVAIGSAIVWLEGAQAYFTPEFFGNTALSEETEEKLADGEVNACSIGYLSVRATPNGKGPGAGGEDVHEARLIEVSLVDKGAKEGAVRVKAMTEQELKKLREALEQVRVKVARIETKSFGVEMMCGSGGMYFATEMMEHLAECVAACQTYQMQEGADASLAKLAKGLADTAGKSLIDFATWLSSGAARGESPTPEASPGTPTSDNAKTGESNPGDVATKWWAQFGPKKAS